MKKLLLMFLLLVWSGLHAATPTPTFTATLTSTPTPTSTATPVAILKSSRYHMVIQPQMFLQDTGVQGPLSYTAAGATQIWLAQVNGLTCAVWSTGTAAGRVQFQLPNNFKGNLTMAMEGFNATSGLGTMSFATNLTVNHFNYSTGTAGAYLGVTTNVYTLTQPYFDYTLNRLPLSLSNTVGSVPNTGLLLKPMDVVNAEIVRATTGAGTGNWQIFRIDVDCDVYPGYQP